ncbi:MAG: DUF5106 domain-containing protein [Bacteroidales bacterium]|nr:DUF5106 domain-containing protein [Bacteroidales bacterium]
MKLINTLICICLAYYGFAADYTISLAVNGFGGQKTYLTKVEGDLAIITDTLTADRYGLFKTTFTDDNETGFYKFIFPQLNNAEVPFIFNKENVAISTEAINPNAYIQVMMSRENDLYYQFLKKNAIFTSQVELLETIYDNYIGDEFRGQAEQEYLRLIRQYSSDMASFYERGKGTFAWKIIKSSATPAPPMLLSQSEKNAFLKAHFFDDVDFADTSLINSEVFTSAAIHYLSVFTQQIQQSNKNAIFMSAVDTILDKASVNETTYEFIVNYLLGGFESMGASEIVAYISQKYLAENSCSNNEKTTLQRKALSNTELAVGKQAPLDILSAMNPKKDIDFSTENIALVFWATWCGHCVEAVPQLVEHYAELSKPKYKLITVSLDTTTNDWEKFINEHPKFNKSRNLIDTNGWDGELAESYYIYATPTIYLIQAGKIVAKPVEVNEFFKTVTRLKWE